MIPVREVDNPLNQVETISRAVCVLADSISSEMSETIKIQCNQIHKSLDIIQRELIRNGYTKL